jgi:hypothetical protein
MRSGILTFRVLFVALILAGVPVMGGANEAPIWLKGSEIDLQISAFPFTPDESLTSGSLCTTHDPDFQEFRYREKIAYCKRSVSSSDKEKIYRTYGVSQKCRKEYTIDHFIPLSVGGTNRPDNLWPEPKSIKALRKDLEIELFKAIRDGRITQDEAIEKIRDAKFNPPVNDPSRFKFCL